MPQITKTEKWANCKEELFLVDWLMPHSLTKHSTCWWKARTEVGKKNSQVILYQIILYISICNLQLYIWFHSVYLHLLFFRSKGVILNISSATGMYPVPLLTIYSATKVNSFLVNGVRRRIKNSFQSEKQARDFLEVLSLAIFKWTEKKRKIANPSFRRAGAGDRLTSINFTAKPRHQDLRSTDDFFFPSRFTGFKTGICTGIESWSGPVSSAYQNMVLMSPRLGVWFMNDSAYSLSAKSTELSSRIAASQHVGKHSRHKIDGETVNVWQHYSKFTDIYCHFWNETRVSRALCEIP